MEKVDSTQDEMNNVSREMETVRKNQKEILGKNTATEMKTVFDGLIRLELAMEM